MDQSPYAASPPYAGGASHQRSFLLDESFDGTGEGISSQGLGDSNDSRVVTNEAAQVRKASGVVDSVVDVREHPSERTQAAKPNAPDSGIVTLTPEELHFARQKRREERLVRERDGLANMNTLLEQAISSFAKTVNKAEQLQQTMAATHALIDKYAEIYDHANATQELLLDGSWELQKDINEAAAEVAEAQRVALEIKRQALHEASLREEQEQRQRRAVEEAERKTLHSTAASSVQGRGRGISRGGPSGRGRGVGNSRIAVGSSQSSTRGRDTSVRTTTSMKTRPT